MNIKKKYFEDFKILKELNKEFNLNIRDTDTEVLTLNNVNYDVFYYLKKIDFINLKTIYSSNNYISDIDILNNIKLAKIELLDLSKNKIKYVESFKNLNCNNLKVLNLNNNSISDIKATRFQIRKIRNVMFK